MITTKPHPIHYETALRVADRLRSAYRHKQFIVREKGACTEIDVYPYREQDTERAPYSRILVKAYNLIAICGNFNARVREHSGHFSATIDRMLWTEGNLRSQHSSLRALVKTHEVRIRALPSMLGLDLRFELVGLDGVGAGPSLYLFVQGAPDPVIKIAYNTYANRTYHGHRYSLQVGSAFVPCATFTDLLDSLSNPMSHADCTGIAELIERSTNPAVVEILGVTGSRERTFVMDTAVLPTLTPLILAIGCNSIGVHTAQVATKLVIPLIGNSDWTKRTALGTMFEKESEVSYVRFCVQPGKEGAGAAWAILNKAVRVNFHNT